MSDGRNGEGQDESRRRGRLWPLFVGLPIIAIIAVGAVVLAGGEDRAPQTAGQEQQPAGGERQASGSGDESGDVDLGHPALGEADAPVVMIEYSDYQ